MYVYLHILSFKFETKIKIEGRTDGEENAEAGKRRPEKGKCILNNFINEDKKDLFRQLLYRIAVFISKMINYKL